MRPPAQIFTLVALLGAGVIASLQAQTSDPLVLPSGSLVSSIVFAEEYQRAHSDEAAVLSPDRTGPQDSPVVAVYTKLGKVFAHLPDGTNAALSLPADSIHTQAAVDECVRHLKLSEPVAPGDDGAHLRQALQRLQSLGLIAGLNENPGPLPFGAAKFETSTGPVLVFDWQTSHCLYSPSAGCLRQQIPFSALTNRPLLSLRNGTLLENMVFCAEFRRTHAGETAYLLPRELKKIPRKTTPISVCVIYTLEGRLCLHDTALGEVQLDGLTAENKNAIPEIFRRWTARQAAGRSAPSGAPAEALLGDTDEICLQRANRRLQLAGVAHSTVEMPVPHYDDEGILRHTPGPALIAQWEGSQYSYRPAAGCYFYKTGSLTQN